MTRQLLRFAAYAFVVFETCLIVMNMLWFLCVCCRWDEIGFVIVDADGWTAPAISKPSASAMMILFYVFFKVLLIVECHMDYILLYVYFTTNRNIEIRNWLTFWYMELNFELNFHGYSEWGGFNFWR